MTLASIDIGLTKPEGFEPALYDSTISLPRFLAQASAIWLRHEFSTHTNNIVFILTKSSRDVILGPLIRRGRKDLLSFPEFYHLPQ